MAMLVLLRLPFVLFALFAPAAAPAAVGENAGDAMVVRSHVLRELVPARPIPHVDREVAAIVPALLSNGTWSDIPYADAERSWWFAAEHLRRCLLMASAFTSPHSRHCGEASVRQASDRAFEWWLKTDPQNQWWWMQIGVPRILCKYLLMLPSSRLFSLAVPLLDRTPLSTAMSWTGCNRVWGASVHVLRGAIELNDTRLDAAFAIAHSTLKLGQQNGDGLQSDGSFHQHGPQLYSGWGYGAIYTTNMLVLERYAQDTDWTIPDLQFDLFAHLVLDGQAQSTRGANFDFLSCGRLFTYFEKTDSFGVNQGHYHYFAAFTPFELAFPDFHPPFTTPIGVFFAPLLDSIRSTNRSRAAEFGAFSDRLVGRLPTSRHHVHFYDSDYTAHHRPEYSVFVHALSSRTEATECVNQENKKGRMMADGTTTVYSRGEQYTGSFPFLNWTLLPGTTEVQNSEQDGESSAAECAHIRQGDIRKNFVGGLSDGGVGVTAMDFARARYSASASAQQWEPALASSSTTCNASTPSPGMHCNLDGAVSVGAPSQTKSAEECQQRCCDTASCSCWTWTSWERDNASPCKIGEPCCWMKSTTKTLEAAINCTGGMVSGRAPAPPTPACVAAGKSWFFSENVTVALGTDIRRGPGGCAEMPITTSIQQSNLFGETLIGGRAAPQWLPNNTARTVSMMETSGNNWVWHDGLLYVVLCNGQAGAASPNAPPESFTVSNRVHEGTEFAITQGDNDTLPGRQVFTMFLSHNKASTTISHSYAYAILASPNAIEAAGQAAQLLTAVTVLSNAKPVQAVCTSALTQIMQLVVWPGSSSSVLVGGSAAGCWDVSVMSSGATPEGVILQVRNANAAGFAISAAAPAVVGVTEVTVELVGLRLIGAACKHGAAGTTVTISVNSTGATTVVWCTEPAM